ncbi:phospholipase D-like domain-containing protein [Roseovarius dicentrarchi]|uniref:phospholipase D-like domain-containing protein n=1 Tax=Roseovarius dicentrarchi TaxID=2250573 RepID=UPI000DEA1273|nr:phospholipase D-like domain-containing protein [Roseovarius dicentrarchi]
MCAEQPNRHVTKASSGSTNPDDVEVLLTAEEVYPAMERAFLSAQSEISAGYRVFDLSTKLRSEEGRAIGQDWFDLITHVLKKGVKMTFVLSDFDPVLAPELHYASWKSRRAFVNARELAGPQARLTVTNATHSARVGIAPRLLLWPRLVKEINQTARRLNDAPAAERARRLECSPALRPLLRQTGDGTLSARRWPVPPLVPGTHHQKICVIDRHTAFIGGLDLDERRYDDKRHQRVRNETWQDVQLMCRGPVADDVHHHLHEFLEIVAGRAAPTAEGRLLRTLSRKRKTDWPFLGPKPVVRSIADDHLRLIDRARGLIYLETQFLRDRPLCHRLARAARSNPHLTLIAVVPAAPETVAFDGSTGSDARYGEFLQAKCVAILRGAFGDRFTICAPVRPKALKTDGRDTLCGSPIIYVHSKVSVFDCDRAIVSSANLNGRSLNWDTEAGVMLSEKAHVTQLRDRIFRHWLGPDAGPEFFDATTAAALWAERARQNADAAPDARKGFLVPYDVRPAQEFGMRLPGIPEAMV